MRSIDIHTHGIGGFDTRSSTVDDLLKIAQIHGASGVAEIVLSIYPASIQTMRQQVELVAKAMRRQGHGSWVTGHGKANSKSERVSSETRTSDTEANGEVVDHPCPMPHAPCPDAGAARILGAHLEGPFLNPAYCGALDPAFFIDPEQDAFRELVDGFENVIRTITVAPERRGAPAFIYKATERGIVVSMGHSDATFAEAEAGFNAGARGITHLFNGMRAFHHREPGLAGFALSDSNVYVEVIADPFHLRLETLKLIFKMKRPDRIIIVSDSVRATKAGGQGRITDASGRLQGGSMTIAESARRLVELGFDEGLITKMITVNPRQYLMLRS